MKRLIQCVLYIILLLPLCAIATQRYFPLRFQITGITDTQADKNANTSLQNLRNELTFPFNKHEIRHFYKKAPRVIQKAILPYGYFRSQVQSTLTQTDHFWVAHFHVISGPQLPVTRVIIQIQGTGKNDPAFLAWKKNYPLKIGLPLNTQIYENTKTTVRNIATQRGYFEAKIIKSQIQINLTRYAAHITMIFNTGPRYRVGKTIFSKSLFHEKFLRRFLHYHTGEYYNANKLEKTQSGLIASHLFSEVLPKLVQEKNNVVSIHMSLIPRKRKEYLVGAGFGTDTGIRGTLGMTLRNIGGNGHRFQTLLRGSEDNSSIVTKYLIPGFDPGRDLFTIAAGAGNIDQATGSARNAKLAAAYSFSRGFWRHSLTLTYLTERYNLINLPKTSTALVYPTLETQYLRLDRKTDPNKGMRFNLQLSGANKTVLSQTNFFQATAQLSTLYTLLPTHTRFIFRTKLGHTNITNLAQLPLSLQLFAGGSHSIRGYGYNSIGPGRNLVTASTELQQRVYGSFYLTGFVDAGVVDNHNLFQQINVGAGPGIAWITTIGTIELTVAQAVTQANKPWSIQFAMGTFI